MKRLLFFLLLTVSFASQAQTYYYQFYALEDIDTGARSRYSGSFYLTYTSGKSRFFQANSDGSLMYGASRRDEFAKNKSFEDVIQIVIGYGPFGPMMGTAVIQSESDGVFEFVGWSNGWREYRAYMYRFYNTLNGKQKYGDGWYIYAYVSDDYSSVKVKNKNPYSNTNAFLYAKLAEEPSNRSAPDKMW